MTTTLKRLLWLLHLAAGIAFAQNVGPGVPARAPVRRVATTDRWNPDSLGNHRFVLHVDAVGDAVVAQVPWRRRDPAPDKVAAILVDARTRQRVRNVARMDVSSDEGWFVFQANTGPGDYYLYYLPYEGTVKSNYPKITYRAIDDSPDRDWMLRNALTHINAQWNGWKQLPRATVVAYEAIDAMSRFTDMEFVATKAELNALRAKVPWAEFLVFPEDRSNSIRMTDAIPGKWATTGAFQPFRGTASMGEFYAFQLGLVAHRRTLDSVTVQFADFVHRTADATIPASAVVSFNTGGIDWAGRPFTRTVHVDRGRVQPLWFGLQVPRNVTPGDYVSDATISAADVKPQKVRLVIHVTADTVPNAGDDEPARLSRLRWLNSQLAADDSIVAPFTTMTVSGSTVGVLGRSLTFGADGLPTSIKSYFAPDVTRLQSEPREVLAAPIRLRVTTPQDVARWQGPLARITKRAAGAVAWESFQRSGPLGLRILAQMEFDGTTEFKASLVASDSVRLADVRLEIPLAPDAAKYMMGLGEKGGRRPREVHWVWDVAKKNQDAAWIGDVNAGLQFTLTDEHYVRPLNTNFYLSKPLILPTSWGNGGLGGCDITEGSEGTPAKPRVLVSCFSGARTMHKGDSLHFDFRLMISPFKPLDTKGQWSTRYFHSFVPIDSIAKRGANTVNVHHATRVNPWINYPFLEPAQMKAYIDSAHARQMKVKIYYTVRELTNHAPELFALRSFGDEVLSHGPGGGYSWLQEHLGNDYIAAWHVPEIKDAAVINSGVSRWHNFYVEGLAWLVKNVGIDGLYIDDVAFDRTTMKRVRKVLDRGNPGALIDLHSANQYNPRDGYASSANLYLEHFPFLNRLWFGEYFDYDSKPDYWLVELSGIPFGLMGEMLEKGGNPWRGMTFGMTNRMPWSGDPSPIWALWDDFGMQDAQMIGWWAPNDPVRTSNPDVLATAYVKQGATMIALGSWAPDAAQVKLTVDWKALGLDPARVRLRAPAIANFQDAAVYRPTDAIPIPQGRGLILIAEPGSP
ncbi:MAG: DUF6067 family protein [Gemmatimonadaceae bacterium]